MTDSRVSYKIAFSMYIAAGGDPNREFDSVEAIYTELNTLLEKTEYTFKIEELKLDITENGTYNYATDGVNGYKPVRLNIAVPTSGGGGGNTGGAFDWQSIGYNSNDITAITTPISDGIAYAKEIYDNWDINNTSANSMFYADNRLKYFPAVDTSNLLDVNDMFCNSKTLEYLPALDFSSVDSRFLSTFKGCDSLKEIKISAVSSQLANTDSMFANCLSLQNLEIPENLKSSATGFMFLDCTKLLSAPMFDTSEVTMTHSMFASCFSLTSIPLYDISKVTDAPNMFSYCIKLTTIPQLDTSSLGDASNMFSYCESLQSLPLLDFGNVYNVFCMLDGCSSLVDVAGFKDIGKQEYFTGPLGLNSATNISVDSMINIINNLYDRATAGYTNVAEIQCYQMNNLTDDQKAIITNKGWTLLT